MNWLLGSQAQNESNQGSEAWKKFRGKGIGSSDIAAILGVSPWRSAYDCYMDKTDQIPEEKKFKGNYATERGTRLEPIAREMYELLAGRPFRPDIGVHPVHSFIRASYDGVNHEAKKMIEIKCPGKAAHQDALCGEVPKYYYPQVQWLMLVSGYDDLDYVSWTGIDGEPLVVVPVKADKAYQVMLIDKAVEFWGMVERRIAPPNPKEIAVSSDDSLGWLLKERAKYKQEIDALTIAMEMTTENIRSQVKSDTTCAGFNVKFSDRKGNVDYSKIPSLDGLDLEPFRKPSSIVMTITKAKE